MDNRLIKIFGSPLFGREIERDRIRIILGEGGGSFMTGVLHSVDLQKAVDGIEEVADSIEELATPEYWAKINFFELVTAIFKTVLVLVVGIFLIRTFVNFIKKTLESAGINSGGIRYVEMIAKVVLYTLLFIIAANTVGIATGSLVALVASVGVAIVLAVRGSLADLASGIMMVLTLPMTVGDRVFLEGIDDYMEVLEIKLLKTYLKNRQNMVIVLPNERIMKNKVVNVTRNGYAYTDVEVTVDHEADPDRVRRVFIETLRSQPKVLKFHEPIIGVKELTENGIKYIVSAPVLPEDYLKMKWQLGDEINKALKAKGIRLARPQLEMRMREELEGKEKS